MPYAWELSEGGRQGLRELEPSVQEEVLDEIEAVAAAPLKARRVDKPDEFVHDYVRERAGVRQYVFITFSIDRHNQLLRVLSIGSYTRILPRQ